jgi:integrase
VQALKRAFNFGVERKMMDANPIRGYKLPRSATRISYRTPEQDAAGRAFAMALKVCIRTGARFGCEFAALRRKHVRDHGDRMEWVFKAEESKTKRLRIVRVTDPEIIALVRQGLRTGDPVFKNSHGAAWTRKMLSHSFRRVKQKVRKKCILLDEDTCKYSCRHTYAKRTLEGFWSGKPVNINTLARLIGNSVQICIVHYLQFSEADNEMLWTSA